MSSDKNQNLECKFNAFLFQRKKKNLNTYYGKK